MNKMIKLTLSLCMTGMVLFTYNNVIENKVKAQQDIFVVTGENKVQRISGKDRFDTCINVAEKLRQRNGQEKFQNIIVSSGFGFADSLSGSVLAKKLNAPIILVGNNVNDSKKSMDYIKNNIDKSGKVYVLGGKGAVKSDIENGLKSSGIIVKRLNGQDRFLTCNEVFKELSIKEKTPFVIVNGLSFADALSVSAPSSIKGYPILLSGKDNLPTYAKEAIKNNKPSEIFVIGGEGALSKNINTQIKNINKEIKITRVAGKDRYDTSLKVNQLFKNNESILVTSGKNYPDALCGSALASQIEGNILLIDENSLVDQVKFINKTATDEVFILGGKSSISSNVEKYISNIFK